VHQTANLRRYQLRQGDIISLDELSRRTLRYLESFGDIAHARRGVPGRGFP